MTHITIMATQNKTDIGLIGLSRDGGESGL